MVGRPQQITGHLANAVQCLADSAVDGCANNLAIMFRVRLLLGRESGRACFRRRLVHAVEHPCLIIHPIRDTGDSRGEKIERFAQIII